ncbi:MAG: nitroreductase [Erysipelotrichaceae bacterium]|nr:nitroreductase [Erysipelotrichaceae bacterium]MBR3350828.1 nitroreductase [Erysipelotrichaceae bacterium]
MNNELYDMIFRRKSFHLFRNTGDEHLNSKELSDIQKAFGVFESLDPSIRTAIRIVPADMTTCNRGEEHCILIYSEKKDGYLQNAGYLGEQLDLYLVSRNIGTLWFGIGKVEEKSYDGLDFVIMIAIKKISDDSRFRKDMYKSKRKPVEEIWKGHTINGVTDIVRFAPSACNTQPWLFDNDGSLKLYRYRKPGKRGIMPAEMVSFYNRIDMGIMMCFLELCLNHEGISFERTLFTDDGTDTKLTLNAEYSLRRSENE